MDIMADSDLSKAYLRQVLLDTRGAIPPEVKSRMDADIVVQVLAWCMAQPAGLLGVYWPMRSEPDLRAAYDALHARGVRLALPVVHDAARPLRFVSWAPGEALVRDAMGVMVPAGGE